MGDKDTFPISKRSGSVDREGLQAPGGLGRTSLDVAVAWIEAQIPALGADAVEIAEAIGRVLAEPAIANADIPSSDRSSIDGIAVRAEDTIGASTYNPVNFRLLSPANELLPFYAARVDAGQLLPRQADAVVPLDHASLDAAGGCEVVDAVATGNRVELRGCRAARGSTLLPAGRQLRPYDIGVLRMAGIAHVLAIRRPKVGVLLTGPRIAPATSEADHDANGPILHALVERDGGILVEARHVERDRMALSKALAAPGPDIIFVVGCTGRGSDDYAPAALADAGELALHGVALNPGETAGIGRTLAGTPVFLLPGVPPACLWAYELLAGRAIRRLAGRNPAPPFLSKEIRTRRKIISNIGLTEICLVRFSDTGAVEPISSSTEADLMAAARADGFVIIPEGSEGFPEGSGVMVYLLGEYGACSDDWLKATS
jgi:molybdopterin molybdotransferase